ncbi:T9SS type A sorting domain-containing protein [Paucihalobacter ruber]|uniref:T9SS type A sorting domain-containing protein n=1 Tax=Paucihalobacter ruber TaxID=2567861 RepID=A0A506PII6_9FLAO|nr:T9SS type A sorting domain-containing protein [Paucihalobacter ruber]TPV33394.1 T9SS type A sorting domain-containing protein [Paucihalobacter ruber]
MKKTTFIILLFLGQLGISQNVLVNGDFSNGLNSWSTFIADFAGVSATVTAANNEANITNIAGAGGQVWHVQLNQILTASQISSLVVGESYKISFNARSNANGRQLRLYFGQDGGAFTSLIIEDYQLTTTMDAYEATVIVGQTFGAMKLGFEMGLSNNDVFIDDVALELNVVDPATNADLSDLQIDNNTIPGFSPTTIDYTFGVGSGAPIPQVTAAVTSNANAEALITQATTVPGDATVVVTAEDGVTTKTYTVSFIVEGPSTAAPTPPARPAEDVISIFSDAYNNIAVDTFDTPWCGATTTEVLIEGNATKKVVGLGCEGVDWQGARTIDATGFTFFHMDIYTDSETLDKSFNVKFSNWAGGTGEANAIEFSVTNANFLTTPNPGTWISLDIPIASFTNINGSSINDIVQFIISSNLGTVYYDNLYLHKGTVLSTNEFSADAFTVSPNPTNSFWNVKTVSQTITNITVFDILGKQVVNINPNAAEAVIDASSLRDGLYLAKISTENGSQTVKLIKN